MPKPIIRVFDGETPCDLCGVVICGFCQGQDLGCKGGHKDDCPLRINKRKTA